MVTAPEVPPQPTARSIIAFQGGGGLTIADTARSASDVAPRGFSRGEDDTVDRALEGEKDSGSARKAEDRMGCDTVPIKSHMLGEWDKPADEIEKGIDEEETKLALDGRMASAHTFGCHILTVRAVGEFGTASRTRSAW